MSFNKLLSTLEEQNRDRESIELVMRAHDFSSRAHSGQFRLSGEAYVEHPVGVAIIIAKLELDITSIVAALLHDVLEDTSITRQALASEFSEEVALIVEGVTKLSMIDFKSREEHQAENLRKMFLAMSEDIRVIIIKLADRLHNMRTLEGLEKDKQKQKAQETLEIYGPLAHRLGMFRIKWELEDLAFRFLEPEMYRELARKIATGRKEREKDIEIAINIMKKRLEKIDVEAELYGRPKNLYSIYQKMLLQDKDFTEIYDLMAMRVLVNSIRACYEVLGIVHELWKPIPGRFKDYIAVPKSNLYQSLHTTVIGPRGSPLEVQIRNWDMHRTAEYGIAAHWRYKEKQPGSGVSDEKLAWLRQMLEWQREMQDAREFMDSLKVDLFEDEVFVFTPKGDVLSLPRGATPVDFAYNIHTEIGNSCVGAKVNGKLVPLEFQLDNGDIVEIMTSKTSSGPSQDWLKFAKTSRARNKIRRHIKRQRQQEIVSLGKDALEKELKRRNYRLREAEKEKLLEAEAKKHNFSNKDELLAAVGYGTLNVSQLLSAFAEKEETDKELLKRLQQVQPSDIPRDRQGGVQVMGMNDLYIRLSRCCNPVPGDEIIGYITRGRGVSIHRKNCPNVKHLFKDEGRTVPVRWTSLQREAYLVDLEIRALNKAGLLNEITTIISNEKLSIRAITATTSKDHTARVNMTLEVSSLQQMNDLIKKILNIEGVLNVQRRTPN